MEEFKLYDLKKDDGFKTNYIYGKELQTRTGSKD